MKFCMKPCIMVEALTPKTSDQNELHTQRESKVPSKYIQR